MTLPRIAGLLLLLLLSGCASEGARTNPDQALAEKLEVYQDIEDDTGRAEHADEHSGETLDRGRLRRDIELLAVQFPGHVPTLLACALVSVDGGEPERAQAYLDRLFRLAPNHPDAALLRAELALGDGNLPLARRTLEQQLRAAPDHSGLLEALAGVLWQQGDLLSARELLARAEALGAPSWRMAFNRALLAESVGQRDEALAEYRRALELDPLYAPARTRLRALEATPAEEAAPPDRREPGRSERSGVPDGLRLRAEPNKKAPAPEQPPQTPEEAPPPEVRPPDGGFWGQRQDE